MHYWTNPLTDPRWPGFIDGHPSASVFHTREWLRALQQTYGYSTLALTQSPPDGDLTDAIPFCRVRSLLTGTRLVSLPFSDHCEPLSAREELLRALPDICAAGKLKYVELRPLSSVVAAGLTVSQRCLFHAIDLRPGLDEIRRKFHNDCVARKIRKAERERLGVDAGNSKPLLDDFFALQVLTRKRHGLPPQPKAWFRNLLGAMGDRAAIRVARVDAKPVAAILTLVHGRTAVYKYGCSDTAANNLGGMQLLLWKAIEDAKNRGMESMDLGRCDLGDESLAVFKERWGAARKEIAYLRYPECADRKLSLGFLSRFPRPLLVAAGRVLYRHMG